MGEKSAFIVGIDLGTTNSALAYVDPARGRARAGRATCPFRSWSARRSRRAAALAVCALPAGRPGADGGRARAALAQARNRAWSASSRAGRARRCPGGSSPPPRAGCAIPASIALPPSCPGGAGRTWPKLSPVDASASSSPHLRAPGMPSTQRRRSRSRRSCSPCPRRSTRSARALTVRRRASRGSQRFTLLEEPQAAFYDFTARHRADLAEALEGVRLRARRRRRRRHHRLHADPGRGVGPRARR